MPLLGGDDAVVTRVHRVADDPPQRGEALELLLDAADAAPLRVKGVEVGADERSDPLEPALVVRVAGEADVEERGRGIHVPGDLVAEEVGLDAADPHGATTIPRAANTR
jgi:hypothetical protein